MKKAKLESILSLFFYFCVPDYAFKKTKAA